MSLTGEAGRAPARMGLPMGDLAGGMFGALAVASALFRRERTDEGTHFDLSLLDGQVSLLTYIAQYFWADGRVPGRVGSGHTSVVPYQAFATRDGHVVVAVFAEKFWAGFCRAIDRPDLAADPRFDSNPKRVERRHDLVPVLEAVFAARTTEEWLARLQGEGVPAAPINAVDQVVRDPQVLQRQMVVDLEHPRLGTLPTLGTPIKAAGDPVFRPTPPPVLGEHTETSCGICSAIRPTGSTGSVVEASSGDVMAGALSRARDISADIGWRGVLRIAPRWVVCRRYLCLVADLGELALESPGHPMIRVTVLDPSDASLLGTVDPRMTCDEVTRRLDEGQQCSVGWWGDELAHYRWDAIRPVYVPYLGRVLRPSDGDQIVVGIYTAAAFRGRGLAGAVMMDASRRARAGGISRLAWLAAWWNARSLALADQFRSQVVGTVGYWALGRYRRYFAGGQVHFDANNSVCIDAAAPGIRAGADPSAAAAHRGVARRPL